MRRGGKVDDVCHLMRDVAEGPRRDIMVVSVGGNDVSNASRIANDRSLWTLRRAAARLTRELEEVASSGIFVIWIEVCPRKDVDEELRDLFNRLVLREVSRCPNIHSLDLLGRQDPWRFTRTMLWRDKIHFDSQLMLTLLDKALETAGLREFGRCWRGECIPPDARMCHRCGRRGHVAQKCWAY